MRDVILVAIILGSVPICFISPYFGVLMWYWVSYFNPHRFTWSFAYNFPIALAVAVPTLAGTLFAKRSLRSLLTRETFLLLALWLWFGITYIHAQSVPFFAMHMDDAGYEMSHVSKILLMSFVMIAVITTKQRLRGVLLVSAGSLGFLAIKATIFGLRTSGEARAWGPPDSFLADNNAFALALNMSLPLLFFLARQEPNRWVRRILYVAFLCSAASVIFTYSRGGMLGLLVVLLVIIMKSRHKLLGLSMITLAALLIFTFAPGAWMDRMDKIAHGQLDLSAEQRLVSWGTAWNFARDYPITGGGFDTLPDVAIFQHYQPRPLPLGFKSSAAHSIYFQLLSDQGFVGLGLFAATIAFSFVSLWNIRRSVRALPSVRWIVDYCDMTEASILAFLTSGAFLSFVYLDVIYQMIATVIVLKLLFRQEIQNYAKAPGQEESPSMTEEEAILAT